ncbi:PTS sugar transporter subunit IIA [Companilactobacillus futsaii]|uniref:PTS mannose/fructose/sorbose family IIA subunit n=2 Tax=Companilactobacillus futsaii TaxID=938155 RepID=A0A5B7T5H5_9LACO|nr:hypothetical protein [Companilactobacillus futsaii]KRK95575.1 hypothetical protein FC88_GL002212 [Companilactobacillus futsaii JCM 17355]QCX25789.1 PTS mannose/fructose/sorbose family IIA subunit [Companilactobacillus futsaii]
MKILLLSHGNSASGILDGYSMIAGNNSNIDYIQLDESGISKFSNKVTDYLDKNNQVLVICDIAGGTPYNVSFDYFLSHSDKIRVISGLNLPMLLELGTSNVDILDEAVSLAKKAGQTGIQIAEDEEPDNDIDF